MKKYLSAVFILSLLIVITASAVRNYRNENAITGYAASYIDMSYKIEREFIENIPVYRDFATPSLVRELQLYDLKAHAAEVVKHGIVPLKNQDDINANVKSGRLVPVIPGPEPLFYFHNVPKENRYLTPLALNVLELTASRFQQKLQARKQGLPPVRLAVSSVIRTVDYQEKIFGRKFVSVHSYGGCFDIFFEDYFVQLPAPATDGSAQEKIKKSLHGRMGYLLGDALREQFRTVLMETLLELQKEKKIYAFLEDDRRCYHITVLVK